MLSCKALLGTGHKNSQIEATASTVPDRVPFGNDRHLDAVVDRKRMRPQEIDSRMDGKKLERPKKFLGYVITASNTAQQTGDRRRRQKSPAQRTASFAYLVPYPRDVLT